MSLELITDRTNLDVLQGVAKGKYDYTDLNRVGDAVSYISGLLGGYGYSVAVAPKTDWTSTDDPTLPQLTSYLNDIKSIRAALTLWSTTPAAPGDAIYLWWYEANAIEKILADVETAINNMIVAYRHCGAATCGLGGLIR